MTPTIIIIHVLRYMEDQVKIGMPAPWMKKNPELCFLPEKFVFLHSIPCRSFFLSFEEESSAPVETERLRVSDSKYHMAQWIQEFQIYSCGDFVPLKNPLTSL